MGLHEFTLEWGQTESIEDWGLGTSPGTGDERELQSCVFDVFVIVSLFRLILCPCVLVSVLTGIRFLSFLPSTSLPPLSPPFSHTPHLPPMHMPRRTLYTTHATTQTGDVIEILKQEGDWWEGSTGGRTGLFPHNYVVL